MKLTPSLPAALLAISLLTSTPLFTPDAQAAQDTVAVKPGEVLELGAHPRLWVPAATVDGLRDSLHTPYLRSAARRVIADAEWLLTIEPIAEGETPTHQQGTRLIASHLKCLTSAYVLTRDARYRAGAMRHLANILQWRHISCEANPKTPAENKKFFCLTYGEHCADVALMYDVFRPDITAEERKVFNGVLDRYYLWQALRAEGRNPWWVNKEWSNWNGVCAGGMGMLALAFYDDRPEARKLIPLVEESLSHYLRSYITNGGGNHEGTGYWNYGMHYAMRYLLAYEQATGQRHPAFDIPEIGQSLHFPVDFHRLTFGDNDGWHPTGMFFMVADRTGQPDAALRAAAYLRHEIPAAPAPEDRVRLEQTHHGDILYAAAFIPGADEIERLAAERASAPKPLARVYENLEWATLADDSAFPRMRLSARGGSSKIRGHGHMDLMSFKCQVDGVCFIEDQPGGTMAVNFTGRGQDLYSRSAAAKSTLMVEGLGCRVDSECTATEVVTSGDLVGIRIDGSKIYLPRWGKRFIGRLLLQVDSEYWLVIDTAPGRGMESRFHTFANVESGADWARLTKRAVPAIHDTTPVDGEPKQLTMTFASLGRSVIQHGTGMPTYPREQSHILRWMDTEKPAKSLHVTALNPGDRKLGLKLAQDKAGFRITISGGSDGPRAIQLTPDLKLRPH